jgi:hypothetical protein
MNSYRQDFEAMEGFQVISQPIPRETGPKSVCEIQINRKGDASATKDSQ